MLGSEGMADIRLFWNTPVSSYTTRLQEQSRQFYFHSFLLLNTSEIHKWNFFSWP